MIIYLGSIYPQSLLDELTKRKQFADYPANVFQHSLLKGLEEHYDDIKIITSPVIHSSYSVVNDICNELNFSHNNKEHLNDLYVGTLPLPFLQMIVEMRRVYKAIKKNIRKNSNNSLLIYALHSPFLLAAVMLRKNFDCTCVVVPDLPEFMSKQDTMLKKIGKKLDRAIINYCLRRLDCYVLLSPYMRDKLPIKGKPWVLMEGIFDTNSIPQESLEREKRTILYCGSLGKKYGVVKLLDAFSLIEKEDYQLWLCGRGDSESEILKRANLDKRIKFYGVVSHDDVLRLQQQATVLINPRSSEGEYTKYSFPSKTMEYLASGTPTIMCHLPAIPHEYDEHLYYIEDESVDGIKKKILEVCEKSQDELDDFGKKASDFIKSHKNAFFQAQKVLGLMDEVRTV